MDPTRRRLLDRLRQSSNAYRMVDPFSSGEGDVPVGFCYAEDQIHPDDAVGESDFGEIIEGVKWQIPAFDG